MRVPASAAPAPHARAPSSGRLPDTIADRKGSDYACHSALWPQDPATVPVSDIHILWLTAGLGCDGDSVSITAATQPSIEDVVMGAIPGLPKVHLHNPVLAFEVGDEFLKHWYAAKEGRLDPFVLVVEGSIPNESIKKEGYWAAMGTDRDTQQPIKTNTWIDWLAPQALAVVAIGTCATYGGIHAMQGNRPAPWAWPITSAGSGGRRRDSRS